MSPLSAQCFSEANAGTNLKDIKTSISNIPIHILEIEQKIVDSLHKMGVYNCGQLFRLPISDLSHRFGGQFALYLKKLIGTIPDPQIFIENKPYFKSDITLIPEVSDKKLAYFSHETSYRGTKRISGRKEVTNRFFIIQNLSQELQTKKTISSSSETRKRLTGFFNAH